jgi:hypothetical protein
MRFLPYCLFIILWTISLHEIGIVGEVYTGISNNPPIVLQKTVGNYQESCITQSPFIICESRPQLSINSFPLLINMYTGGIYDWPGRILFSWTNSFLILQIFYGICALFIIGLTHKIANELFTSSTYTATLILSIHPCFLLYKKILGGTEIALQIGILLIIWGLFQKKRERWMYLGVTCAIFAKWVSLVPICVCMAYLLFEKRIKASIIIFAICISIMAMMYWFSIQIPDVIRSHDDFQMQWNRLVDNFVSPQKRPNRENWYNLFYFFTNPLMFFSTAYQAIPPFGKIWTLILSSICWIYIAFASFQKNARIILLSSISLLLLTAVAKDLHHLAMVLPILALGVEEVLRHKDLWIQRSIICLFILAMPVHLVQGDSQIMSISTPTFAKSKQAELIKKLQKHNVEKLITMDYEIYGVIEMLDPEIEVLHTWGAISHEGYEALPQIIDLAKGNHLLVCTSSMPMIYNLHPPLSLLRSKAQKKGLQIKMIEEWKGVVLYEVK